MVYCNCFKWMEVVQLRYVTHSRKQAGGRLSEFTMQRGATQSRLTSKYHFLPKAMFVKLWREQL